MRAKDFSSALLYWYARNKRELPWRETTDPYAIWLSEVILQQTRVAQGLTYYQRLLEAFPDVHRLAAAPEDALMKLWQGLGYYSRARHLHETAKQIASVHKGLFPGHYVELLKFKGIGEYTAAAIASISFGEPVPVIDGNVLRVYARYAGIREPVDELKTRKVIKTALHKLIDRKKPADFNQALMELGALVCTVRQPDCRNCPLLAGCYAYSHSMQELLPVKRKKKTAKARYFHYLAIFDGKYTYIRKRGGKDIWKSLYEFPLIETAERTEPSELMSSASFRALVGTSWSELHLSRPYKHQLTHQTLHCWFYLIRIKGKQEHPTKEFLRVPLIDLPAYAFPRLIEKYLQDEGLA